MYRLKFRVENAWGRIGCFYLCKQRCIGTVGTVGILPQVPTYGTYRTVPTEWYLRYNEERH